MKAKLKLFATTAFAAALVQPAIADETALDTFVKEGKTKVDFRYRYEGVEQDGIDNSANANTLRTRLTFESGSVNNFSFKLEMDDVRPVASEKFNSTSNGNTDYPVVADPKGTDLNQAFVQYKSGGFAAIGGRQRILLDDQRFVGGVGWRQNEQTYDGLSFKYGANGFTGSYNYVNNVNRIFGPTGARADLRGDVHLVNGSYAFSDAHKLTGFIYSMDFENGAALSNDTYGLRYVGDFGLAKLTASYATQSEAGDNPTSYTADYMLADLGGKIAGKVSWNLGYEVLGSDNGDKAFMTPLATLHKFQGWSDKFLGTPAVGIQDLYAGIGGSAGPVKLKLVYHQYAADSGGDDLGSEINAVAIYPINKKLKTLLKFADYSADTHATDTQKIWFMVQMSL
ncbi:Alginate export [Alteromonadaceae bacterium Bs31]|nr:Alginate export [Alteromonadaceae bacterium Bs31]